MTKYYDSRTRGIPNPDLPISLPNYEIIYSREEHYCPYCSIKLSKLQDHGNNTSWYCSKCVIEYPDKSETKSKSRLSTQKSSSERPAVSYPPEPQLSKKDHSIQGGLAALKAKGLRITNYKEGVG